MIRWRAPQRSATTRSGANLKIGGTPEKARWPTTVRPTCSTQIT